MKTFNELQKILSDYNAETLKELTGQAPGESEDAHIASVEVSSDVFGEVFHKGSCQGHCDCYCGSTGHADSSGQLIADCLDLNKYGATVRVAVGAVLDNGIQSTPEAKTTVLVIGINYGQRDAYAFKPVPLADRTNMRSRLTKVLEELASKGCATNLSVATGKGVNLVAANFFPWITQKSWSEQKINSLEESLLIECTGHEDSVQYIADLIAKIGPEMVVFHGANNIVPALGVRVVKRIGLGPHAMNVVFCDNLAQSSKIYNAVVLCHHCRQIGRENLHAFGFDE